MGISLISISHRVAPLAIRELFAFPEEQQRELMRQAVERGIATECILISTCNRTEIYTYSDREESNFTRVQELLLEFADAADVENIGDYIRLYSDTGAVAHLFRVAAGLDSMVMGEDQILGQVKRAHDQARKTGTCGVYLNTLFYSHDGDQSCGAGVGHASRKKCHAYRRFREDRKHGAEKPAVY